MGKVKTMGIFVATCLGLIIIAGALQIRAQDLINNSLNLMISQRMQLDMTRLAYEKRGDCRYTETMRKSGYKIVSSRCPEGGVKSSNISAGPANASPAAKTATANRSAQYVAQLPAAATDFNAAGETAVLRLAQSGAGGNAQTEAQLTQLFKNMIGNYEQQGRRNNLAGALTFMVVSGVYVLNDGREVSEPVQNEITQYLNDSFGSSNEFKNLPVQQKREAYQTAIILGGLTILSYQQGMQNKDPQAVGRTKNMARELLGQISGCAADRIKITAELPVCQ